MIYELDELGYLYDKPVYAHDFPGGERRLIQKPTGLRYTIVNGTVTFEANDCTGALPRQAAAQLRHGWLERMTKHTDVG